MVDQDKRSDLIPRIATKLATGYLRFVGRTSRVVYDRVDINDELRANSPFIFAFWHGQFLLLPHVRPSDIPTGVMVARHEDADLLGSTMEAFDMELIRGAGAGARKRDRGGATALRVSLKALKTGISVGMTADVPPGPARKVGEGIVTIGRMSGRPIIPGAVASSRFKSLNTWSRLTVNLPFSTIGFATGDPVFVPRDGTAEEYEQIRCEVETQLNALTDRAYKLVGADADPKAPLTGRPTPPGLGARFYRGATRMLEPIGPFILNRRAQRGKEDVARQNERLGHPKVPRPEGRLAWFHAASVGELNAIRPLLSEIRDRYPDLKLLVTTGTVTSAKIAQDFLADVAIHQFIPIDGPRMVRRFLEHWRPNAAFFVESEIWPNLVYETAVQKIPLVLLNARMSEKSIAAWRKFTRKRTAASLFTRFDLILAQTSLDLLRFTRLGASKVEHVGNLKIDAPMPRIDPVAQAQLSKLLSFRPVFIAASTHPGEEQIIAEAHRIVRRTHPDVLTVIVPRHPERGALVEDDIAARDLHVSRRSVGGGVTAETDVYIADTIGELPLFYEASDVAFLGGSLVPHGGQNPVEAIRHDLPALTGPHIHNFEEVYDTLRQYKAVRDVSSAGEIADTVTSLLDSNEDAAVMQANADEALATLSGALSRTLERIEPYLSGANENAS